MAKLPIPMQKPWSATIVEGRGLLLRPAAVKQSRDRGGYFHQSEAWAGEVPPFARFKSKVGRFTCKFHLIGAFFFCFVLSEVSPAYVLEGAKWQFSPVNVQMGLSLTSGSLQSPTSFPLMDGSTSWEQVYTGATGVWNAVMANLQLTTSFAASAANLGTQDGINEAYFGTSIGGTGGYNLQPTDLAITLIYYNGSTMTETDTVFNSAYSWNSYPGPLLNNGNGPFDFRRVAIHELGHTIGLADIDGTVPLAIMDIDISNLYNLTSDDIAGAQFLYGAPGSNLPIPTSPVILPFLSYSGDFNADGKQDILWRNIQTGEVRIWYMNGSTVSSNDSVATVGLEWKILGIADFDGTGFSDILWENANDGSVVIWSMRGDKTVSQQFPSPGNQWSITGVADLDNTGLADILWRNVVTGDVRVWVSVSPFNFVSQFIGNAGLDWNLVGTADLFGDGFPELIWRNQDTGEVRAWRLSGDVIIANVSLGFAPIDWEIVGFGDFTGAGRQDILWRNTVDGSVDAWIMNGFTIAAQWFPGAISLDWQIRATPDVNGNGINSILWSNVNTGQQVIWASNGSAFVPAGPFAVAAPAWAVQPEESNGNARPE
jgi:FG-GAP-like repeat/Matrixin